MNPFFLQDFPLTRIPVPPQGTRNLHGYYEAEIEFEADSPSEICSFYAEALCMISINGRIVHYGPCRSLKPLLYADEFPAAFSRGKNIIRIHQVIETLNDSDTDNILIRGCNFACLPRRSGFAFTTEHGSRPVWRGAWFKGYENAPINAGTGFAEYVHIRDGEQNWAVSGAAFDLLPCIQSGTKIKAQYLRKRPIPLFTFRDYAPVSVTEEPGGTLLADLGTIRFGFTKISGETIHPGEVRIEYIESLTGGWISPSGQFVMYDDRIVDADGPFEWMNIHKRAYQYARIHNMKPGTLKYALCDYTYPLRSFKKFRCSDPMLNRLAEISEQTVRINLDDIITDCPHRDQGQWMDAYSTAHTVLSTGGSLDLTEKCIEQYANSIQGCHVVSPSIWGDSELIDYTFVLPNFVLWFYRVSGKTELVKKIFPNLKETIDCFSKFAKDGPLLYNPAEGVSWIYLDNTFELARNGYSAGVNALYLSAVHALEKLAGILNEKEDEQKYHGLAEKIRNAYCAMFAHPTEKDCFMDVPDRNNKGFAMVNFSCELGHWDGETGVLEFEVESADKCTRQLETAHYKGVRICVNGQEIADLHREESWQFQPVYAPDCIPVPLKQGNNHFRFEVPSSALNWELFFRWQDDPENFICTGMKIGEIIPDGTETVPLKTLERLRRWVPPVLSQSTQGYAGFAGIYDSREQTLSMLRKTLCDEYFRTYISIRVPSFCTLAGKERERLPWIMPDNTPWPTFFLLTALERCGGCRELLQIIRKYWHNMVVCDHSNTTYEEWGRRSSLCHAWGAVALYFMHSTVLGVKHETRHTGTLKVRPYLGDFDFAEGEVGLADGRCIGISLRRENGITRIRLEKLEDLPVSLDTSLLENPVLE